MKTKDWTHYNDDDLLQLRICDLDLQLSDTFLKERIQTLYDELKEQKICFQPVCYLADEWFTPEDEPTIGIPFYLAHPRLVKLEQSMMMEAEGADPDECLRLLRHEAGHAFSHAYGLLRKKSWRAVFGNPNVHYDPDTYKPRPYSRSFVTNLRNWYAQSHPEEDWAETFAVWLNPTSHWKKHYKGWPAYKKLLYVDRLMATTALHPPPKKRGKKIYAASRLKQKLMTYYQKKRALYQEEFPDIFDQDLKRIFTDRPDQHHHEKASRFLSRHRRILAHALVRWARAKKYTIDGLLKKIRSRCDHLELRVLDDDEHTLLNMTVYLTTLATNYLHTGKFKK